MPCLQMMHLYALTPRAAGLHCHHQRYTHNQPTYLLPTHSAKLDTLTIIQHVVQAAIAKCQWTVPITASQRHCVFSPLLKNALSEAMNGCMHACLKDSCNSTDGTGGGVCVCVQAMQSLNTQLLSKTIKVTFFCFTIMVSSLREPTRRVRAIIDRTGGGGCAGHAEPEPAPSPGRRGPCD